jgi:DNA-binding MarR family transcriptional regulator
MARDNAISRLERSPLHLLHRAGQCAAELFQIELGGDDLTPRQYAILSTVARNEGVSQTQLVELTGIDRSTLADVVRRMIKKGLLQRRRTRDDARAYAVKVTDEGSKVLKAREPLARKVDERILSGLPAQQRDRFIQDLGAIIQALNRLKDKENASKAADALSAHRLGN